MRLWCDVLDAASGQRLGRGPVSAVAGADITRALDGAGSWRMRCPGTDARALELLQPDRRVRIWAEDAAGVRLMGEGIIRHKRLAESPAGITLHVSGPDMLDELKRRSVLLGRIYNQQTVATVANDLIGLVPGWSVQVDSSIASEVIDARYDGVSILRAFQDLAKRYGYHLRAAAGRVLEVGPFGADSGLRVMRAETITQETLANPSLLLIERIQQDTDSEDLCNWLLPVGAGEGEAALTLRHSTRNTPYPIETITGPDGSTLYYIRDAASISSRGEARKVGQFKEIAPLSNSEEDIKNAANALYDAAVEYIQRHSVQQELYQISLRGVTETIRPGDKIHINYKAQVLTPTGPIDYMSIRDDVWVLKVMETVNLDSSYVQIEFSQVDRYREGAAERIMNGLESIELRNLKPQIAGGVRSYVYDREIAPGFPAQVPIEFTDATLSVQRVRLRLRTMPFRATAQAAAGGGNHNHRVAEFLNSTGIFPREEMPNLPSSLFNFRLGDAGIKTAVVLLNAPSADLWTEGASGSHTHEIAFGITDDTQTPSGVTVWVNGTDRTSQLFGSASLAGSGGALNVVADMGALTGFITGAAGGLRQVHTVEVRCAGGRGRAEVTVEVFETTQAIKLT